MAPLRRYLRISKYSVLEVRIFLEDPAFAETWLLRPGDPALPRVLEAVRPLVLPKLREENERARGKGKGKKGVKDVVSRDEFDVSIFLTETSTRHSLLIKSKDFKNKKRRIQSNSGKMTGWLDSNVEKEQIENTNKNTEDPIIIREEEDENNVQAAINLNDIPEVPDTASGSSSLRFVNAHTSAAATESEAYEISSDESGEGLKDLTSKVVGHKGKEIVGRNNYVQDSLDNKKKLLLNTTYEGFSIYGRILCLIVNYKKPTIARKSSGGGPTAASRGSQKMLEQWVSSQAVANNQADEVDDG